MRDRAEEVRELFKQTFGAIGAALVFDEFPERVVLLQDEQLRVYQIRQEIGGEWDTWGLVCLSQEFIGGAFIEALGRKDLTAVEMSFAEARDLAKSKDVPCLFLLDDPDKIVVHWVR